MGLFAYDMSKVNLLMGFMVLLQLDEEIVNDFNCYSDANLVIWRYSELYMVCSRPQPASDALAKGARALEDAVPDEAIQLYTEACSILEEDDKEQMAFDLYRAATCVYIKLEK
ncbi:hypothetical protein CMV_020806 [Castanea mollissima]|uniref:Gamma-soluble NSF attachment protein n=1 Tax=Castanea mollissima TaxID=60419 RepID=A0A8J4QYB8_9ROSI|nr:hypothetical protein CMV_020806 [Castanea mollissima]